MAASEPSDDPTLLDFVNRFLRDEADGEARALGDYLARYPGREEAVAREFLRLRQAAHVTLTPSASAPASRFGAYEVERELGRGGQAVVYLARDVRLRRAVALKVMAEGGVAVTDDAFARFAREAAVISRLDHPGICAIYETGSVDGCPFIAMQYVEGQSLAAWINLRPLGESAAVALPGPDGASMSVNDTRARNLRVLQLIEATARALDSAHRAGVVHRDVKPSNILVRGDGAPVLVDFGLAFDEATDQPSLTRSGLMFGTPAYMSPEQVHGDHGRPDLRTDVYSLGVTLYEALGGERPFAAATREGLYRRILEGRPRPLRRLNPTLSREIEVVVATAMDRDPDRRYQSAAEFAADLQRIARRQPIHAAPPSLQLRLWRWTQRNPLPAGLLVALAAGLVVAVWFAVEMATLRRREQSALERVDGAVLANLRREAAEELWPELLTKLPDLEAWCQHTEEFVRGRLQHWRSRPAGGADDLVPQLEAFLASSGPLADVRARAARVVTLSTRCLQDGAGAWTSALAAAGSAPRYRGVALPTPTYGLMPLGIDAHSGLLELWHPRSGSEPIRGADGRFAITADTAMVFVLVPGGRCRVGTQRDDPSAPHYYKLAEADEAPVHEVELAPFLLSKYETTQGQWERLTGQRPSQFHRECDLARHFSLDDDHPVEHVDWHEACRWLARYGMTLPTEAQWEYACRAGTGSPWWVGDDLLALRACANVADTALHAAYSDRPFVDFDDGWVLHAPVGTMQPNAFGLHHMHGNVAEWCLDGAGPYATSAGPGDGLRAQRDSSYRVVRGGHFEKVPEQVRSGYRSQLVQDGADYWLGLRPVLRVPP